MTVNEYIPFLSEIKDVIQHTEIEFTFRMAYQGEVKPGQFFEVSLPKYGEAPISVSGIGEDYVDLTIRKVGKVTNEIFNHYKGQHLFLRGPYTASLSTFMIVLIENVLHRKACTRWTHKITTSTSNTTLTILFPHVRIDNS